MTSYIGSSTRREILHATAWNKGIEWMFGMDPEFRAHFDQDQRHANADCSYCVATANLLTGAS